MTLEWKIKIREPPRLSDSTGDDGSAVAIRLYDVSQRTNAAESSHVEQDRQTGHALLTIDPMATKTVTSLL